MGKTIIISLTIIALSQTCLADSEEDIRAFEIQHDADIKKAQATIPKVVEGYATSLGCQFLIDPANVVPYQLDGRPVFIAVFSFDVGCSGGSAMSRPVVVVLEQSYNTNIYVNVAYSTPKQTSDTLPQVIKKIFLHSGKLWYSALVAEAKDPLCCPSKKESGRLVFDGGIWQGIPQTE